MQVLSIIQQSLRNQQGMTQRLSNNNYIIYYQKVNRIAIVVYLQFGSIANEIFKEKKRELGNI